MTRYTTDYDALYRYSTAAIPVTGTEMSLAYNCRRMLGRDAARSLSVPLIGDDVPGWLNGIDVTVEVAGQVDEASYDDPSSNLTHEFDWDGRTGRGNPTHGSHPVDVDVDYRWQGSYGVPDDEVRSFAQNADSTYREILSRATGSTTVGLDGRAEDLFLTVLDYRREGLGGWSLTGNHRYDSNERVLYRGDGQSRSVRTSLLNPTISVVAGKDPDERLSNPAGISLGVDESVYVADNGGPAVRRFEQNGGSTTLVGTGTAEADLRQTRAVDANLQGPVCAREGPDGDVYISDADQHVVVRLDAEGFVELVVGRPTDPDFQPEAVSTQTAQLANPNGIVFDDEGALLITEGDNHVVRRVEPGGETTVVAGTGTAGYEGDGGPAREATLARPSWIERGPDGWFYVADSDNHAIRRFQVGGDIETVVGGNGNAKYNDAGDGGPATAARLSNPLGVAVSDDGTIYVGCSGTHTVRRVAPDGTIETFAGGNGGGYTGNGGPAVDAKLRNPTGVAVADDGSVYVSEWGNGVVRRVDSNGTIEVFNGWLPEDERTAPDEQPLLEQGEGRVGAMAVATDGTINFATTDSNSPGIWRITPDDRMELVAGDNGSEYEGDGGPATDASFVEIADLELDDDGRLYVVDEFANVVRRIDTDGRITTVAGTGTASRGGVDGDDGPATEANLTGPQSVAVSPGGELYIAETGNGVVRRVDASGTITTHLDRSADLGSELSELRRMPAPTEVALDQNETLYVGGSTTQYGYTLLAELSDGTLRYVTAQIAPEDAADADGRGRERYGLPEDVSIAPDGTMFLSTENYLYRATITDEVSRIAGVGHSSFVGDEGPAKRAGLRSPEIVTVGPQGQLYVSEYLPSIVRRVDVRLTGESATIIPNRAGTEFYEFDASGYHTATYDADTGEAVRSFSYDEDGLLTSTTDVDGETTTIERDDDGNPTAIVAPNGQRTSLSVDRDGYLDRVETPAGEATVLSYVDDGLLSTYEAPGGRTVEFAYDDVGKLDSVTTAAGTTTISESESGGTRTVTRETPLGRTTTWEVDHGGDVTLTTTSPSGAESVLTQYEGGGMTRTSRAGDEIDQDPHRPDPRFGEAAAFPGVERQSTPSGTEKTVDVKRSARMGTDGDPRTVERLVETESVDGRTLRRVFDATDRERTTTTPAGRSATVTVDAAGRPTRIDHDGLAALSHTYDDTGRVEAISWGSGSSERAYSLSYDDGGRLASVTDPRGETTSFARNDDEQVTETTLRDGRTVDYGYTAEGVLSSLTTPGGSTYGYAYDGSGRLDEITLPDGSTVDYAFTEDGDLSSVTQPDGSTVSYTYDSAGRTDEVDLGYGTVAFDWDGDDRPERVETPDGVALAFEFDGSLLTERTWSGPVSGTVQRTYDDAFRLATRTVAGNTVSFDYDDDDRRTGAGDLDVVRNDDTGLVDETTLAGTTESWTHTGFGTVDTHSATVGGTTLYEADYTYDDWGLVTELTETVDGETTTREFEYDANGRLTREITDGTTTQEFGYDGDNNRTSHTRDGSTVTPTYDGRNRLQEYGDRTYDYDDAGRLEEMTASAGTTTYDYDGRHNLRSVTLADGTTVEYLHDGFDRRVAKRVDGTITRKWLYRDGRNPVAELDGNDDLVAQFVYGTRDYVPDYMIRDGTRYRIVTDHLGSPRLVVDVDGGSIAQRIDYDAFGRVTRDTDPGFQPFGFAGGLYDPDTGLVRHGARDYDPRTGRWTTPDPLQIVGGTFNRYEHVRNAPLNVVDRSGLAGPAGFGIGFGTDVAIQSYNKGVSNVDWGQAAVAGGVAAFTGGLGNAVGSGVLRSAGVSSLGGALEHAGKKLINGECVTWSGTAKAATIGGVTGGGGQAVKDRIGDYAEEVAEYNDVSSHVDDLSPSEAMKPSFIETGGETAVDVGGKITGAGINAATSSPDGASR